MINTLKSTVRRGARTMIILADTSGYSSYRCSTYVCQTVYACLAMCP